MHELAVTESILNIALETAKISQAVRVTDIYITIGRLSSIVDDSVQFYWDHISKGSICEGARLHFNRLPATLRCLNCGEDYTMEDYLEPCPHCQSVNVRIETGDELRVDKIDVEGKDGL